MGAIHCAMLWGKILVVLLLDQLVSGFDVVVNVGSASATTNISTLTSVTMDVCLAKRNFDFSDPLLLALTKHLGGGGSILRIGGTDQNSLVYALNSSRPAPFSARTGAKCCQDVGSCKGCVDDCSMPAPYWKKLTDFASASGHQLMFGLVPDIQQATALIAHSAAAKLPVVAYTFGNEVDTDAVIAGYPVLRRLFDNTSVFAKGTAPMLAGPDVALQRHASIENALADKDPSIRKKLDFVHNFTRAVGGSLDVVSWHTYDFETSDLGMTDHRTLKVTNETSRFWDTRYLDMSVRLLHNMSRIARQNSPGSMVWLSETDSVCHQGIDGVTNAYLNSVWLVNRLCIMASANVSVMARQSLVGYNYSLLGNWPIEPIRPNPDYFTTILFRRLFGDTVLSSEAVSTVSSSHTVPGGDRARAYAFCAAPSACIGWCGGAISLALMNFDPVSDAHFKIDKHLGAIREYLLLPDDPAVVPGVKWASRHMMLNGQALSIGADGSLPAVLLGQGTARPAGDGVVLPPLSVGFVVLAGARHESCYTPLQRFICRK